MFLILYFLQCCPCSDFYEPNDSISQAHIMKNYSINASIYPLGDQDWFYFEVTDTTTITFHRRNFDYDFRFRCTAPGYSYEYWSENQLGEVISTQIIYKKKLDCYLYVYGNGVAYEQCYFLLIR